MILNRYRDPMKFGQLVGSLILNSLLSLLVLLIRYFKCFIIVLFTDQIQCAAD
jgi:hypothetical protein